MADWGRYSSDTRGDAVDDFDDHDPTPYGGGYDITLTYGRPLPPSEDICHPISTSSSSSIDDGRPFHSSGSTQSSPYQTYVVPVADSGYDGSGGHGSFRPKPHPSYGYRPQGDGQEQYGYGGSGHIEVYSYGSRPMPQPAYGFRPQQEQQQYEYEGGRRTRYGSGENEDFSEYGSGFGRKPQRMEEPSSEYGFGYGGMPKREGEQSYGYEYGKERPEPERYDEKQNYRPYGDNASEYGREEKHSYSGSGSGRYDSSEEYGSKKYDGDSDEEKKRRHHKSHYRRHDYDDE